MSVLFVALFIDLRGTSGIRFLVYVCRAFSCPTPIYTLYWFLPRQVQRPLTFLFWEKKQTCSVKVFHSNTPTQSLPSFWIWLGICHFWDKDAWIEKKIIYLIHFLLFISSFSIACSTFRRLRHFLPKWAKRYCCLQNREGRTNTNHYLPSKACINYNSPGSYRVHHAPNDKKQDDRKWTRAFLLHFNLP